MRAAREKHVDRAPVFIQHFDVAVIDGGACLVLRADVLRRAETPEIGVEFVLAFRGAGAGPGFPDVDQFFLAASSGPRRSRSEEHTSELQSLMRTSYPVVCLNKQQKTQDTT